MNRYGAALFPGFSCSPFVTPSRSFSWLRFMKWLTGHDKPVIVDAAQIREAAVINQFLEARNRDQ